MKNGDRWTVLQVGRRGDLTVRHRHGRTVRLPVDYVATSVELGYATTVHTAQGVTADTMHGLVTGGESRQQLYTMLTRGGTPTTCTCRSSETATRTAWSGRDGASSPRPTCSNRSWLATTPSVSHLRQREQQDPAVLLGDATSRYIDALYVAAEDLAGPERLQALETAADQVVPDLTSEPAWPTLRAHLLLLTAHGTDPVAQLAAAADGHELSTALTGPPCWTGGWTTAATATPAPARCRGSPAFRPLRTHPVWGEYLAARADLIGALAAQVKAAVDDAEQPPGPATAAPSRTATSSRRAGVAGRHPGQR